MSDRRRWHAVDPTQFNDGVLYLPDMVEIQPREPDWGLGSIADLLARINDDRPHRVDNAVVRHAPNDGPKVVWHLLGDCPNLRPTTRPRGSAPPGPLHPVQGHTQ